MNVTIVESTSSIALDYLLLDYDKNNFDLYCRNVTKMY
jgi:hypothetical protein